MKNQLLRQGELENLGKVIEACKKLKDDHNNYVPTPQLLEDATDLEIIHMTLYVDILKDIVGRIDAMEDLLTMPQDEFIRIITNDGELTIEEVKLNVYFKVLTEVLGDNE